MRNTLSIRLGQRGFVILYTTVASFTMCLLIVTIAYYGGRGSAGAGISDIPAVRWTMGAIALVGASLAVAGIINYRRSPMAVLARRWRASNDTKHKPLAAPAVVERITRHPFFVGVALLMGAHAVLADTLSGSIFFLGFVLLALIGIPLQDRKLSERHGDTYKATMSNKNHADSNRNTDRSLDRKLLLGTFIGVAAVTALHPLWQLGHGATFAAVILVGGLFAVARQLRSDDKA